jgi:lipoprotein signal peptidase
MQRVNNTMAQTFICFGLTYSAYFLCFLLGREVYYFWGSSDFWGRIARLPRQKWFWFNFLPSIFFFGIGLAINAAVRKRNAGIRDILLPAFILIALDQAIQSFMAAHHGSIRLTVVENWLTIIPLSTQFKDGRYISAGRMPLPIYLAVNFLSALIVYALFRFLYFFEQNRKRLDITLLFYGAGYICSCLNLLFRKGGYDYISLYPFVVLDLKDIYIDISICTLTQSILQNYGVLKKVHLKDLKKYGRREYQTIKRLLSAFDGGR